MPHVMLSCADSNVDSRQLSHEWLQMLEPHSYGCGNGFGACICDVALRVYDMLTAKECNIQQLIL